ncbi:N-acetylmuramoyl-L-alanine amidase [Anaerosalibacter bizertensis]|uniref:N-acetylmuramoyl-L-alanine amidase n=1 Tax=Anaerosalibacter bizertensis TaxID=932217 RepID=UPI001C0EEBAA|nr:N-acetylmuramoyl-L-alanine amidase [Anaerosalibacter bizertensis]MBU5293133.1 N-acetylmuramoyl-L-alanine amidase [Anaerosalibacter bizertensis]
MIKICIDSGHGGNDPGAVGHGVKEKDYTLKISQYQAKRLKEHGFKVVMTRETDTTLSNSTRTTRVKNSGAKVCISNHVNAATPSASGAETIHSIYSNGKLANMILDELVKEGFKRRRAFSKKGKRGDYYFMHRQTGSVETVIVEHGFITNAGDVQKLKNNWKKFAEADVKAICKYMGVKYIPEKNPTPSKSSSKLYRVQTGAFSKRNNADNLVKELKKKGYDAIVVKQGNLYKVQTGAFSKRENADNLVVQLKKDGFEAFVI